MYILSLQMSPTQPMLTLFQHKIHGTRLPSRYIICIRLTKASARLASKLLSLHLLTTVFDHDESSGRHQRLSSEKNVIEASAVISSSGPPHFYSASFNIERSTHSRLLQHMRFERVGAF
jgi:hypothetical protein